MLNGIAKHKRCHARHRFKLCDSLAKILFFKLIDVECIEFFKDGLKVVLESLGGLRGIGKVVENLGELCHRRYAYFIPVKKIRLTLGHPLVGKIVRAIFKQTRVKKMLQQGTRWLGRPDIVAFLELRMQLCDEFGSVTCGHIDR